MRAPSIVLIALAALASTAYAEGPQPADPAPRPWALVPFEASPAALRTAADAVPPLPDSPLTGLYSEHRIELTPEGHTRVRYRRVMRIEHGRGIDLLSTLSAQWEPSTSGRPLLRARVVDPRGGAHHLDPAQLAEDAGGQVGPTIFTKTRRVAGPLPRLSVGAIVETEVTFEGSGPVFASGVRVEMSLVAPAGSTHHRVEWRAPSGTALTVAVVDGQVDPVVSTEDGVDVWRVDLVGPSPHRPVSDEAVAAAPWDAWTAPLLVFGTTPSWAAAAAEYHGVVEAALGGPGAGPAVAALAEGLPKGDARAAARALAARIHERTRYTGVHFGRAAIVPRSPAVMLDDGFGDCKDLAVLFVGAMRAAGYGAQVALVRAQGPGVEAGVPGLGAFDHAIARVEVDPPLWVDLTASHLPAGELTPSLFGRRALVIAPKTTGLSPLPRPSAEANLHRTEHRWRLGSGEPGRLSLTVEARGVDAQQYRALPDPWGPSLARGVEPYVQRTFATKSEAVARVPGGRLDETVRLSAEVDSALGWHQGAESGVWYETDPLFAELPAGLLAPEAEVAALRLHASTRTELVVQVAPPPGHVVVEQPTPGTHALGPATLVIEPIDAPAGEVGWRWRLDTGPRVWSAEDVRAFRAAVEPFLTRTTRKPMRFEHRGHRAITEGRVGEGLRIYRDVAAGGGGFEQLAYIEQLALAGYPHFARALAERYVEQHPERAEGWRSLGHARLMGLDRTLGFSSDRAGAIEALEKALALDPTLGWAPVGLAIALVEQGGPSQDRAALERALGLVRGIDGLEWMAAELAFQTGQPGMALEVLRGHDLPDAAPVRVAAQTVTAGVEAGVAALRRIGAVDARHAAARGAASRIANAGDYATAGALLAAAEAAFGPIPGSAPLASLSRHAPSAPETAPAALAGLMAQLLAGAEPAKLAPYASPGLIAAIGEGELAGLVRGLARGIDAETGLDRSAAADLVAGLSGSSRPMASPGVELAVIETPAGPVTALVAQGPDGPRVVALPGATPTLHGHQMADALARGDVIAALQWRMWAVGTEDDTPRSAVPWGAQVAADFALSADAPLALSAAALLAGGDEADRARARALLAGVVGAAGFTPPTDARFARPLLTLEVWLAADDAAGRARVRAEVERRPDDPQIAAVWLGLHRDDDAAFDRIVAALPPTVADAPPVRLVRVEVASQRGRFAEAIALGRAGLDAGGGPRLYNALGWLALFVDDGDLAGSIARLESARPMGLSRARMHTLAALYAAHGQPTEARATMLAMLAGSGRFEEEDWLVIGLLAEHEGLPEVARDAWRRLPIAPDGGLDTSAHLARRGLARLGTAVADR